MEKNDILKDSKNLIKDIGCVLLPFILYIALQCIVAIVCASIGLPSEITGISGCGLCIIVLYPFFYKPLKKKLIKNNLRIESKIRKKTLVWIVLSGVCGCFVLNGIVVMVQLNKIVTSYDSVAQSLYDGNILLIAVQMIIMAPAAEELLFRGLLYQGLQNISGKMIAAIVSSLLFGLLHGNLLQGVYAFILGIILSLVFEKYQSLKPCILFHMSANAFSLIGTKTSLLSFVFSSWWVVLFYTIISGLLLIIGITKIITNKCSDAIV